MWAEQAIFTSLRTATRQGYHLVARSEGVHETLAQGLRQWSPSNGSLLLPEVQAASLNSFSLGSEWSIVSRTIYGAPEYSGRGALQVFTIMLALRRSQLAGYDDNPLALARTAMILGHLRLPPAVPERLPNLALPDRPLLAASTAELQHAFDDRTLDRSLGLLAQGHRIALVDTGHPLGAVAGLLERAPRSTRRGTSFTTGLRPSRQRPFRVHVLPRLDAELRQRLSSQGIRIVTASP